MQHFTSRIFSVELLMAWRLLGSIAMLYDVVFFFKLDMSFPGSLATGQSEIMLKFLIIYMDFKIKFIYQFKPDEVVAGVGFGCFRNQRNDSNEDRTGGGGGGLFPFNALAHWCFWILAFLPFERQALLAHPFLFNNGFQCSLLLTWFNFNPSMDN